MMGRDLNDMSAVIAVAMFPIIAIPAMSLTALSSKEWNVISAKQV